MDSVLWEVQHTPRPPILKTPDYDVNDHVLGRAAEAI